ncbi:MAG: ABC transporter substrate-binding protein [Anaerolineales bacterium]|nr:ABC transporter substrate-binding protein [Anaerolineales bacterium]
MKKFNQFFPLLFLVMFILAACQSVAQAPAAEPSVESAGESEAVDSPTEMAPPADEAPSVEAEVIKVGAAHALSGPIALYGEPISQGIQLAVAQMNAQNYLGEGKQIEVVYEDTAGDKEQAISVFEKLINQDGVVAILGPTLSNSAFAADPIAQEAGVPVIGSSNTASGITEMGDFVFRTSLPESAVIPNTLQVVADARGMQDVAVMYGNDDQFTQSGYEVFASSLENLGTNVVTTETFAKGDADFNAQLTKIKSLAPQAIIASALAEEAANIMSQARQQGIEAYFIGGNGFNSPKLAEIAGDAAEGAISGAAWFIGNPTPENQTFVEAYRAEFGTDPDQFAAQAYTAAWVLGEAIKSANSTDPAAIRDALTAIQNLPTPLGEFSFDANRDPLHTPVVLIVKDGQFALFEE